MLFEREAIRRDGVERPKRTERRTLVHLREDSKVINLVELISTYVLIYLDPDKSGATDLYLESDINHVASNQATHLINYEVITVRTMS